MQLKHPNPCYPGGNTKPYDHPRVDVNPTNETTCDLTQNGTNDGEPELQHTNQNNKDPLTKATTIVAPKTEIMVAETLTQEAGTETAVTITIRKTHSTYGP